MQGTGPAGGQGTVASTRGDAKQHTHMHTHAILLNDQRVPACVNNPGALQHPLGLNPAHTLQCAKQAHACCGIEHP